MFRGKPIIGIVGGIGSGKSFVARVFGEMGGLVVHSDDLARQVYDEPAVREELRGWWGEGVFKADGQVDRSAIAAWVFADPVARERLERLLHPRIGQLRDRLMERAADDPQVVAYVWDAPLLFEAGLNRQCDAVVFVDAPLDVRVERVRSGRGWDQTELLRRENVQWPLDTKRKMSDHVISNAADVDAVRIQVRKVLSLILAGKENGPQRV